MKQKLKMMALAWALTPYLAFATTLTDGLVAHYRFDGNALDSSGNGNDGIVCGATLTADRFGNENSAYKFDGFDSAQYIKVSDSATVNSASNQITISAWIRPERWNLPDGGVSSDTNHLISVICKGTRFSRQFSLQISNEGYWYFTDYNEIVDIDVQPSLGTWHHVAISASDGYAKAYLDGVCVGIIECDYNAPICGADLCIGLDAPGGIEFFDGAMDDVRIYNRGLSDEDVRALYEGYSWVYDVSNEETCVLGLKSIDPKFPALISIVIPPVLGGKPVTSVGINAFADYTNLTSVTIPASVTEIGSEAFSGCEKLADVWFEGNTIGKIGRHAFLGCYWDLIMHVPVEWQGRGRTIAGYTVWRGGSSDVEKCVNMTVTNVVVQYVLNSIRPEIAVPVSNSVGLVNIITEVASSGAVSVPTEWKDNYQQFETKFGTDFGKALAMKTGKKDGAGNDMFVWQDFVAGTDPTDESDQFTASITMVDGVPVISYTPELTAEQAALRVYKTYGKMKLTDTAWTDLTAKTSEERANYNFFKVTVEMK